MPLADDLMALASQAGKAIVAATATDAWESVRRSVVRLFGRGGHDKAERTDARLADARRELTRLTGADLAQAQVVLARQWAVRLADLLEENPSAAPELRVIAGQVLAIGYSAAAGRDMSVSATGGIAAGTIHADAIAGPFGTAVARMEYSRREIASQPVSLPPRPSFLRDREDLIAELRARLAGDARQGPRLVTLCGLGGVGKSSVAAEYAHRQLANVGIAWQLPAENLDLLEAEFARLAGQLGTTDPVSRGDPVAAVHGALAASAAPWLLVFDNAPDEGRLRRYLPPAGHGQVVVTSRNPLWTAGQVLEVPVLGIATAAEFLLVRTGDSGGDDAAELAGLLGGLPLALEQAAAYMLATGTTVNQYLDLFRERSADLLDRGEVADHPLTVAATFRMALDEVDQSAPQAGGLLRMLACLAPEPVPLALLLVSDSDSDSLSEAVAATVGPLLGDRVAANDAVAALRRYSLVTLGGDNCVQVHRLVQAATIAQMPSWATESWRQAAATLLDAAVPLHPGQPPNWAACSALLPHVLAVLSDVSPGKWRIARYLGYSGAGMLAIGLWREIATAFERIKGTEDPATLAARHEIAVWTGLSGQQADARDMLVTLLPVRERVLGAEDESTLSTRYEIAVLTGELGEVTLARDMLVTLLRVRERVLGTEHASVLSTRHEVARWTGHAGDPPRARDMLAALLPVRQRVSGAEHASTLSTRHELASWTGHAGDPVQARDMFAALLPIRERVIGCEHRHTLSTRHHLACWTGHAGDPAQARDMLAALLPVRERVLGARHPATDKTRAELAYWSRMAVCT